MPTEKTKIDSSISKQIYNDAVKNLSVIFLYEKTIVLLKSDDTLKSIVKTYINLIKTYEDKNKIKEPKLNDFLIAYKTITGLEYAARILNKNEYENIDDSLAFLSVFVMNTLKIEWNDILNSFADKVKNTSITLNAQQHAKPEVESVQTQRINDNDSFKNTTKSFNNEEFMRKNNISMDQVVDNVVHQQAALLLQKDIVENRFYRYDSKPNMFIWLKWFLFASWILFSLSMIVIAVLNLATPGKTSDGTYIFVTIPVPTATVTAAWYYANAIVSSGGGNVFNLILSILFPLVIMWYAYGQVKNNKNDNVKFTAKTGVTWIMLFFCLITIFYPLMTNQQLLPLTWLNGINNPLVKDITGTLLVQPTTGEPVSFIINNAKMYPYLLGLSISTYFMVSFLGLSIIASIMVLALRPKNDINRMNQQIAKYIEDIKSGRIDTSGISGGPASGFGGRNPFSPF